MEKFSSLFIGLLCAFVINGQSASATYTDYSKTVDGTPANLPGILLDHAEISVDPTTLTQTVAPGETATQTVTISNTGTATLTWSAYTVSVQENRRKVFSYPDDQGVDNYGAETETDPSPSGFVPEFSRSMFDLIDYFSVVSGTHYSVATDGQFIYSPAWNANIFRKYSMNGVFIEQFSIEGAGNLRDITYDGHFFYGSPASNIIYKMDFSTKTLVETIVVTPGGNTIRGICYDPDNDAFWVTSASFSGPFKLISRSGETLQTLTTTVGSMSGLAYDNITPGGPYLWAYTPSTSNGSHILVKIDMLTGQPLHSYDIATAYGIFGPTSVSGGLNITNLAVPGMWTFLGISQSNVIWIAEVAPEVPWLSLDPDQGVIDPGMSQQVIVDFDAGGLMEGTYYAEIIIDHDGQELGRSELSVPVTFEILATDPPAQASGPIPPSGAANISVQPLFSWTNGEGTTTSKISIFQSGSPVHESEFFFGNTYNFAELGLFLEGNQSFQWWITGKNGAGETVGPTWEFTTMGIGNLQGTITDGYTGNPLQGALVSVDGTGMNDQTDANGEYFIADLPHGTYNITITKEGYFTFTTTTDILHDQTSTVNAELFLFLEPPTDLSAIVYDIDHVALSWEPPFVFEIGKNAAYSPKIANNPDVLMLQDASDDADFPVQLSTSFPVAGLRTSTLNELYNNGPLVTGMCDFTQELESAPVAPSSRLGTNFNNAASASVADDFTVPTGQAWNIESMEFWGYQTYSTEVSTITGIFVRIWDANPLEGGSVIWGDLTTNLLLSTEYSGINRTSTNCNTDRRLMHIVASSPDLLLYAGTYWIEYAATGSMSSGPFAPTISFSGQTHEGNNGIQRTGNTWTTSVSGGVGIEHPFILNGEIIEGSVPENLIEFKVYRNGDHMATVPAGEKSFGYNDGPLVHGLYSYEVTAVYGGDTPGESNPDGPVYADVITCFPPSALYADEITTTTALLGWAPGYDEAAWNVEIGLQGFEPGADEAIILYTGITTNTLVVSDLDPATEYEFYVQSACTGRLVSNWAGPESFITDCDPMQIPAMENFDNATPPSLPICWSKVIESNSINVSLELIPHEYYSPPNSVTFFNSNDPAADLILIAPEIGTNLNGLNIGFMAKGSSSNTILEVGTYYEENIFSTVVSYTLTTSFSFYQVTVTEELKSNQKIAFRLGKGNAFRRAYLDDVLFWYDGDQASIAGAVSNIFGDDVENARVYTGSVQAFTDFAGYYLLDDLYPQTYDVIAEAGGYGFEHESIDLAPGENANLDFVFEYSNPILPFQPQLLSAHEMPHDEDAWMYVGAATDGQYAYIPMNNNRLYVYDYENPEEPETINSIPIPADIGRAFWHEVLYLGSAENIQVYDVIDPANPLLLSTIPVNGTIMDMWFDGDLAYALVWKQVSQSDLLVFDVSDHENIVQTGILPVISGDAGNMYFSSERNLIYIHGLMLNISLTMSVVEVNNRNNPTLLYSENRSEVDGRMTAYDDFYFLVENRNNRGYLLAYSTADPANPQLVKEHLLYDNATISEISNIDGTLILHAKDSYDNMILISMVWDAAENDFFRGASLNQGPGVPASRLIYVKSIEERSKTAGSALDDPVLSVIKNHQRDIAACEGHLFTELDKAGKDFMLQAIYRLFSFGVSQAYNFMMQSAESYEVLEITRHLAYTEPPAIKFWTGNKDSNWHDPNNWEPPGVPGPDDHVFIPAETENDPVINGLAECGAMNNFGDLKVNEGGNLAIGGNTVNEGVIEQLGGASLFDGTVFNPGTWNHENGEATFSETVSNSGAWYVTGGVSNYYDDFHNLELGNWGFWGGTSVFGAAVINFGEWNHEDGSTQYTASFENFGIWRHGGGESTFNHSFDNNATVDFSGGYGIWYNDFNNQETATFDQTGGTSEFGAAVTNFGEWNHEDGSTQYTASFENFGTWRHGGGESTFNHTFDNNATVDFSGGYGIWYNDFNNQETATFDQTGGTSEFGAAVSNLGSWNHENGEATFSETITNSGTWSVTGGQSNWIDDFLNNATFNQSCGTCSFKKFASYGESVVQTNGEFSVTDNFSVLSGLLNLNELSIVGGGNSSIAITTNNYIINSLLIDKDNSGDAVNIACSDDGIKVHNFDLLKGLLNAQGCQLNATGNANFSGGYVQNLVALLLTGNQSATLDPGNNPLDILNVNKAENAQVDILSPLLIKTLILQGGELKIQHNTELNNGANISGGTIKLSGTPAKCIHIKGLGRSGYSFVVEEGAAIHAKYTTFSDMNADGIYIKPGAIIDPAGAFYNCAFSDGATGGVLLTINNDQEVEIENATFLSDSKNATFNVRKSVDAGSVTFITAGGNFAGEEYEDDEFNRIHWSVLPPEHTELSDMTVYDGEELCYDAIQTITVQNFTAQTGSSTNLIAGNSILFLPETYIKSGAALHAWIAVDGLFCNDLDRHFLAADPVVVAEKDLASNANTDNNQPKGEILNGNETFTVFEETLFKVYPNPTTGIFTIEWQQYEPLTGISVDVFNMQGNTVYQNNAVEAPQVVIDLSSQPPGVYFVRVVMGRDVISGKLIKQ